MLLLDDEECRETAAATERQDINEVRGWLAGLLVG